jgi:hypothetical protein
LEPRSSRLSHDPDEAPDDPDDDPDEDGDGDPPASGSGCLSPLSCFAPGASAGWPGTLAPVSGTA